MEEKKYPPISIGTKVKTTNPNMELKEEWTEEAWEKRKWGITGTVIEFHDSHGLYYKVLHEDETTAAYDPTELVIITNV